MNVQTLREKTIELLKQHPAYAEEFEALLFLALDEIEEGGSEQHECDLAYNDMLAIIEDYNEDDSSQDLAKEQEHNWLQDEIKKQIENGSN